MPGKYDVAHCDDCGVCEKCYHRLNEFTDLNPFTEEFGDWNSNGDEAQTVNSNAQLIYPSTPAVIDHFWIKANIPWGGGYVPGADTPTRIIFNWADSNNYAFSEFDFNNVNFTTAKADLVIRFGQVAGGITTIGKQKSFTNVSINAGGFNQHLCYSNGRLRAYWDDPYYLISDSVASGKFGVGSGTVPSLGIAKFDDFEIKIDLGSEEECGPCPTTTNLCLDFLCEPIGALGPLQVIISDLPGGGPCCAFLNGTFELDPTTDNQNLRCQWNYGPDFSCSITITATLIQSGTDVILEVSANAIEGFNNTYNIKFRKTFPMPTDCLSFNDDLTFHSETSGSLGFDCDHSSAGCHVNSI